MSIDILLTAGSAIMGYIMKYNAIVQNQRHQEVMHALDKIGALNNSADLAAKRVPDGGVWVRRVMALMVITVVSILALGGYLSEATINVPIEHPASSFLIFSRDAYTEYKQLKGAVVFPELLQAFIAFVFFYAGAGQARGK